MRAIFLDRDGVICENRSDHVKSWDEFHFIPGSLDALSALSHAGFTTFIVTNQAIVNRGIVSADRLEYIHAQMLQQIVQHGGYIQDIAFCPHETDEKCDCRKPQPGMLTQLATKWNIDLSESYMIGDAWTDIAAGRAMNCRSVLVQTGRGAEQLTHVTNEHVSAHHISRNLSDATEWIFQEERIEMVRAAGSTRQHFTIEMPRRIALSVRG